MKHIVDIPDEIDQENEQQQDEPPSREVNARLIVAAVNAVREAMPDLTDEQRIERLEAGTIKRLAVAARETLKEAYAPISSRADGDKIWVEFRAALETTGGQK